MRSVKHVTAGLMRFAAVFCAFTLILLCLSFGQNPAWIAVPFALLLLLLDSPRQAPMRPVRLVAALPRLPSPRAPPAA